MAYQLEGRLLELCTCGAHCPCQATGEPNAGDCTAVNAWHVEQGSVDGTDVSGLTLVALSHVHGHVLQGRPVVYYVDDKATDAQQVALLSAWKGEQGGPLADVAGLIGQVAGVERAPMTFAVQHGKGNLRVGHAITAAIEAVPEMTGHTMAHSGRDICTTVPGEEIHPAQAATYRVHVPAYDFLLDLHNHPLLEGRFRFEG